MAAPKGKRRIMRGFQVHEVSSVDYPAQKGAKALLMKRADAGLETDKLKKYTLMTSDDDGHAHLIDGSEAEGGHTSYEHDSDDAGHSHPWLRGLDGSIMIGASSGHTHTVLTSAPKDLSVAKNEPVGGSPARQTKSADGGDRGEGAPKQMEDDIKKVAAELEATKAELQAAKAFGQLSDAEKAHYSRLDGSGKESFLKLSVDQRQNELGKDAVVYTALDGSVFRKSDDPRLVATAKRADENEKLAKAERELRLDADLAKRAEELLSDLPGDLNVRKAVLRAVDSIADQTLREGALALLKAGNTAIGESGERIGTRAAKAGSAEAQLEAMAQKFAVENKMSIVKARSEVLRLPEAAALAQELS